jgi:hypothetical protein
MNITINKVKLNGKLYTIDNKGTSLIKHGSLIESSGFHKLIFVLNIISDNLFGLGSAGCHLMSTTYKLIQAIMYVLYKISMRTPMLFL